MKSLFTIFLLLIPISIYPNPSYETLSFLSNKNLTEPVNINIINANGQSILEINQSLYHPLNISNLPTGFYFVKISSSFGHWILKFIKK